MLINHKFEFVDGPFDTDTGKLVCVKYKKYGEVLLCWRENMNIEVAKIVLHSSDLASDADAVFEDAAAFGDEVARRWNLASVDTPAVHPTCETADEKQTGNAGENTNGPGWISNAQWPEGFLDDGHTTTEFHQTEDQAYAACEALKSEGFDGDGMVLPILTWVTAHNQKD